MKNFHGIDEEDIVFRMHDATISGKQFFDAMRELQVKAQLVAAGLDEFNASEIFTLKMAGVFKNTAINGGTHTTLPDDIMMILYPTWKREKET